MTISTGSNRAPWFGPCGFPCYIIHFMFTTLLNYGDVMQLFSVLQTIDGNEDAKMGIKVVWERHTDCIRNFKWRLQIVRVNPLRWIIRDFVDWKNYSIDYDVIECCERRTILFQVIGDPKMRFSNWFQFIKKMLWRFQKSQIKHILKQLK